MKLYAAIPLNEASALYAHNAPTYERPMCKLPGCHRRVPRPRHDYCCKPHRDEHLKIGRWKEPWRCL